ncbi:MAG TPA: ABC transporter substrate-binding protein [Sphingomicrobium sp.]|nr:ABC transporter substrate-binding protein [Sphingomicrobium sp.]
MRPNILSIIALALFAFPSSGCDRQPEGVVQVVVIGEDPALADPRRGPLETSEAVLVTNAAQGLVRFDARGQIEPGLAETWNVSDDGLSYIFRLAKGEWPNGREITADHVARMLRRLIGPQSRSPLKDAFWMVDEIVPMTERVLEIRLSQPRPHLLQLLAQPEMGLVYEGQGSGPFSIDRDKSWQGKVRLFREVPVADEDQPEIERLDLSGAGIKEAIAAFVDATADLVLGGTFADLPLAQQAKIPAAALQFDPASGLFGLIPARNGGLAFNPEVRELLSAAIDREALVSALSVPGLLPRTTVLEPGLDGMVDPVLPDWAATPIAERQPELAALARRLLDDEDDPVLRIRLPEGPGADILLDRLSKDWGALGIEVERAGTGERADLRLIDKIAPSSSADWFVGHFSCGSAPVCNQDVDTLLEAARTTPVLAQRTALLHEASRRIDAQQLYIPIAAPIRWSLVSSRISGFAGNRFSIHTLTGLEQRLNRAGE